MTLLPDVLKYADYNGTVAASASQRVWVAEQEPRAGRNGALQTNRIALVPKSSAPGTGGWKPGTGVMRVELRPYETKPGAQNGDVTVTGGYAANRAEVYGRAPIAKMAQVPPNRWPDPVHSTRYYTFGVLVPDTFTQATDTKWIVLTQWKGLNGTQPPLALEIKRGDFRLGGNRTNAGLIPAGGDLGPIKRGTWTQFTFGIRWSPSAAEGWVEVYRDGQKVIGRTPVATMDASAPADPSTADPVYFKQGLYRDTAWTVTHIVYFGQPKVTNALTSSLLRPPPK